MQEVKSATRFRELRQAINRSHPLIIQTHDFPDYDAIATAFALQQLLLKFALDATICYGGSMQSTSVLRTVNRLDIEIRHIYNTTITADTQIILVDCCRENLNVAASPGKVIAMIDHHENSLPYCDIYPFADVRPYGACSTILTEYYLGMNIPPAPRTATALMIGIMMDTANLTRGVSGPDFSAVQFLFSIADWDEGARLLRNSLTLGDLDLFYTGLRSRIINEFFCFVPINFAIKPDAAGLLADFFLTVSEISFVVVVSMHSDGYRLSVRSEHRDASANLILKEALADIGAGGGHATMAGGIIKQDKIKDSQDIYKRFEKALKLPNYQSELAPSLLEE